MITEDYVSFETAKLLKEKGFDAKCKKYYNLKMLTNLYYGCEYVRNRDLKDEDDCSAPSLGMAMKWLREVHKLSIEPYYNEVLTWVVDIKYIGKHTDTREFETVRENWYKTYEQACEAAIKYCLENLI